MTDKIKSAMRTFSFRLDGELAELVERDAQEADTQESSILRQIIRAHYKRELERRERERLAALPTETL